MKDNANIIRSFARVCVEWAWYVVCLILCERKTLAKRPIIYWNRVKVWIVVSFFESSIFFFQKYHTTINISTIKTNVQWHLIPFAVHECQRSRTLSSTILTSFILSNANWWMYNAYQYQCGCRFPFLVHFMPTKVSNGKLLLNCHVRQQRQPTHESKWLNDYCLLYGVLYTGTMGLRMRIICGCVQQRRSVVISYVAHFTHEQAPSKMKCIFHGNKTDNNVRIFQLWHFIEKVTAAQVLVLLSLFTVSIENRILFIDLT